MINWVPMKRGDSLPANAVYAGITKADGEVYISKIDNSPGKVNLVDGKINNFWSQNYPARTKSEVLVVNGEIDWIELKYGETIPENAICSGRDLNNDKVWVAKDVTTDEPGKLTCIDSDADKPKMCRLWCHSYWAATSDVKLAKILIVKPPALHTCEEDKPLVSPINSLEEVKPLWGKLNRKHSDTLRLSNCFLHCQLSNLIKTILLGVKLASGELTSMTSLITAELHAKISGQFESSKKEDEIVYNDNEKTIYVIISFTTESLNSSCGVEKLCNCLYSKMTMNYTFGLLYPANAAAVKICEDFKGKFVTGILTELSAIFERHPDKTNIKS
tara:strand:+ start:148 stop:1140 length:993 start_codon:yes stop_codon:yes gene_type:complete